VTQTVPGPPSTPVRSGPNYLARRLVLAGAVLAVVVAGLYLALVAFAGGEVPSGTTVLGVRIGGMSRDQAVATLTRGSAQRVAADLKVRVGSRHISLDPVSAGLSLDPAATVDALAGRTWNPVTLLARMFGDQGAAPLTRVDTAKLTAAVATTAADTDVDVVEPRIVFTGTAPRLQAGRAGHLLDQGAAAEALAGAYLRSAGTIVLPVRTHDPAVSSAAAGQALAAARVAVSGPVTVRAASVSAVLTPAVLARALTYEAKGGQLTPVLAGDLLRTAIAPRIHSIEVPGRDATWDVRSGRPVVVPSRVGRGVNPAQLATAVSGVLGAAGSARSVTVPIGTIAPSLTTAQAAALGITEQMSSFTQHFPYAAYRKQNIGQAAKYVNGTLLRPGDTFSMNDTIKERTPANGYTVGFVVGPGGVFKEDLGGGVSTATTTVWTAAFYAGLERVFTQAHSIWISRYRAGLEATVAWGSFDMRFRNDTAHGVLITTVMRDTSLTVTMWGTKAYSQIKAVSGPRTDVRQFTTEYDTSATCHAQSGEPGFAIVVTRQFYRAGTLVRSEPILTRYRPSPEVVCHADPSRPRPPASPPAPSPSPSASRPPA
jgi:vancomycin resistance protein YoaR